MSIVIKHIDMIKRIDQLIRMQATGTPEMLADKLKISRAKLYRKIQLMRDLEAPIIYDIGLQSYIYEHTVGFQFGFYGRESNQNIVQRYC